MDLKGLVSEVCEISYKFILETSHKDTFTTYEFNEKKIIAEYHSFQMLNKSFLLVLVSEVCEISSKLFCLPNIKSYSLLLFLSVLLRYL